MFKCDICGRKINKKNRAYGYILCSKHMHQYLKYGKFLDTIQRTNKDLNEYRRLDKNVIEMDVYYQNNTYCDSFIFDKDDLEKIKYHKWRKDSNNHIVTGNCTQNKPRQELTHIIMNIPKGKNVVVDHINGNPLDNRKKNLRICSQSENMCNKSFMSNNRTGFIGIYFDKSKKCYCAEIKRGMKCYLGGFSLIEEAIYCRYIAELQIFKDFRNTNNDKKIMEQIDKISQKRKKELYDKTIEKIKKKNLITY